MAQQGYLFITGAVQEEIETNLEKDGVEGGIPFYRFRHSIRVPGSDIGGREGLPFHGVIEVLKEVDETSPQLFRSLCLAERLTKVSLEWYTPIDGVETLFYSITVEGCRLVGITAEKPDVRKPENEQLKISEVLEISYRTIRWEYGLGNADLFFDFDTTAPISIGGPSSAQQGSSGAAVTIDNA